METVHFSFTTYIKCNPTAFHVIWNGNIVLNDVKS